MALSAVPFLYVLRSTYGRDDDDSTSWYISSYGLYDPSYSSIRFFDETDVQKWYSPIVLNFHSKFDLFMALIQEVNKLM